MGGGGGKKGVKSSSLPRQIRGRGGLEKARETIIWQTN